MDGQKSLDTSERKATAPSPSSPPRQLELNRVPGLLLKLDTPKGRGVFATQHIPAGTVVDICPVLILSPEDNEHVAQTSLYHYSYNWPVHRPDGRTVQHQAIIFGLGSMFNHSSQEQNVVWRRELESQTVIYTAIRDVNVGDELCISYGSNLWFKDADARAATPETEADVLGSIQLDMNEDEKA